MKTKADEDGMTVRGTRQLKDVYQMFGYNKPEPIRIHPVRPSQLH